MANTFCLIPQKVQEFKQALREGRINPERMAGMASADRRAYLEPFVGKENAQQVNALFESKLLLKNQKAGYITWAKKVGGITPAVRRDLLSRIERMDKVLSPQEGEQFLADLAAARLGIGVTEQEAQAIADLAETVMATRVKAREDGTFPSNDTRLAYGAAVVDLEAYTNELKLDAQRISFREEPIRKVASVVGESPGILKSLVASLDNSFFGRQGIKTLLDVRTAPLWTKNFLKSWGDIAKELAGRDAMHAIRADIYSRPNALNGKYKAGRYGLDVLTEEAFPSSLPEKILGLRRLFRASESAYNGAALRLRADLADRYIKIAEKQGINTLDRKQAEGIGTLIGSMTGRGSLGKGDVLAREANVLFFSIKFLKANIDTLTLHAIDGKATAFTRKEAAKNLLSMTMTVASVLTMAKLLDPDSVDEDPRSTNFGKVKVFGHFVDITGGMAPLVRLAAQLVPTYHEGTLSFWSKSGSGKYTNLLEKGYGKRNALDVLEDFFEGKLSPIAGIARDVWRGETFNGGPPTVTGVLQSTTTPLSLQSFQKMMDNPDSTNVLGSMILEALGFSSSVQGKPRADWLDSPTKAQQAFLDKVGKDTFLKANEQFNAEYQAWLTRVAGNEAYQNLSASAKQTVQENNRKGIQIDVMKRYGFTYKEAKDTPQKKREDATVKKLSPK